MHLEYERLHRNNDLYAIPMHFQGSQWHLNRGGRTLGVSGWGCAAGTLEPLTYTRASSAKFCYPILE